MLEKYPLIIGLTGSFGSGSSTVAKILESSHGFLHIKISSFFKEECQKRKIDPARKELQKSRSQLQDNGNILRKEQGGGYLIKRALDEAKKKNSASIVLDSIKNPEEVIELKRHPNSYLIAINASHDTRWKRVIKEARYYKNYEIFEHDDKRDADEGIKWGQNVQKCVDMSDVYITNEEERDTEYKWDDFKEKLREYITLIKEPGSREPTIPELLMNNAYCTSLLSNCLKRQVGAIIAIPRHIIEAEGGYKKSYEEKYVISAGYNAVPEGQRSCEMEFKECYRDTAWREFLARIQYCPKCGSKIPPSSSSFICSGCDTNFKDYAPSKNVLDLCRALHAEESAILQTARLGGTSLVGATLYTTTFPCLLCAKKIIVSGIKRVVWLEAYPAKESREMLENANVELTEFEGVKARVFYELFSKPI